MATDQCPRPDPCEHLPSKSYNARARMTDDLLADLTGMANTFNIRLELAPHPGS